MSTKDPHTILLVLAGVVLTTIFAVISFLSGDFELVSRISLPAGEDPLKQRPVVLVVALFLVAFSVYLFAVYRVCTNRLASNRTTEVKDNRLFSSGAIPTIIGFAVLLRLVVLFSTPILEIDLYRYIWDGNALAAGVSPYDFSPQQVLEASSPEFVRSTEIDPKLQRLAKLSQSSASLHSILSTIHFGYLPSPYPPTSQCVFALSALITPDQASLETHRFVMRFLIVLFDLATLWVLVLILRTLRLPTQWCVGYAWCPLVIKEFANSGHLDSITVFFTVLAAYVLIRQRKWAVPVSAGLLAVATAGKFYPLVLTPIFFMAWMRLRHQSDASHNAKATTPTRWRQGIIGTAVYVATAAALLYPMLRESTSTNQLVSGENRSDGLHVFVRYFEMNDFLFMLAIENLKPQDLVTASHPVWFVVVPETVRESIAATGESWGIPRSEVPFRIARILSVLVYGALVAWMCWRIWRERSADSFLRGCFGAVAWLWFLSPTLNPWYWTWALAFIPFVVRREWLWISGLTLIYYLRFWFEYQYNGVSVFGTGYQGTDFFDYVVTWIEFGPWFGCFVLFGILRLRRSKAKKNQERPICS